MNFFRNLGNVVSRNMGNNSVIDNKDGKGKKKSRGKRTGKDSNVQETIDPVRKSNLVAPEVHVGQKVYVTLDTV